MYQALHEHSYLVLCLSELSSDPRRTKSCPLFRGRPVRDTSELRSGNSDRVPSLCLFGQNDLAAEALALSAERAEVDTGGQGARGNSRLVPARRNVAFGERPDQSAASVVDTYQHAALTRHIVANRERATGWVGAD